MRTSSRSPCSAAWSEGFTLLELMVVIGIISVLAGVGVGYLGQTDPSMLARSMLRGELRSAQLTARADGVPTEVRIDPGRDGLPATVRSRLLEPIVTFHLEPSEPVYDEVYRATLSGDDEPNGRFGHARRSRDDDREPVLRWPLPGRLADLRDGFVLRCDLFFEERPSGDVIVFDLSPLLELRVDRELRVESRLRIVGLGDAEQRPRLESELSLPLRRWCTLEVGCDTRAFWIAVDGRRIGTIDADGVPQQDDDMTLVVSPSGASVPGLVDEVRLAAFAYSPAQYLPPELRVESAARFTFDDRGEPDLVPQLDWLDGGLDGARGGAAAQPQEDRR